MTGGHAQIQNGRMLPILSVSICKIMGRNMRPIIFNDEYISLLWRVSDGQKLVGYKFQTLINAN